jgi:general secretion pathway protein H
MADDRGTVEYEGGSTLVEVLMTLALVALALGMALPMMRGPSPSTDTRLQGQRIAAALKAARVTALAKGHDVAFTFLANENAWLVSDGSRVQLPGTMTLTLDTARIAIRSGTSGAQGSLVFFPDGSATGGRVTLRSGRNATTDVVIEINWFNGAVTLVKPPHGPAP